MIPKSLYDFLLEILPPEWDVKHAIKMGNAKPVNLNAYLLSNLHMDEQVKQVIDLLNKGLIQNLSSLCGFPVLFIKKPVG